MQQQRRRLTTLRILSLLANFLVAFVFFFCSIASVVTALSSGSGSLRVSRRRSNVLATTPTTYDCTFFNLWLPRSRHPIDFPTNSAHWSRIVLAAHNASYTLFRPGALASPGVEGVAEVSADVSIYAPLHARMIVCVRMVFGVLPHFCPLAVSTNWLSI